MHESLDPLKNADNYTLVFETELRDGESFAYTHRVDGSSYYQSRHTGGSWFESYVLEEENGIFVYERFEPEQAWSKTAFQAGDTDWFHDLVHAYMNVEADWLQGDYGSVYALVESSYRDFFNDNSVHIDALLIRIAGEDITMIIEGTTDSPFVSQTYAFKNIGRTFVGEPQGEVTE